MCSTDTYTFIMAFDNVVHCYLPHTLLILSSDLYVCVCEKLHRENVKQFVTNKSMSARH